MLIRSGIPILLKLSPYNTKVAQVKTSILIVRVPGTWLEIRQLKEIEQKEESRAQEKQLLQFQKIKGGI